MSKVTLFNVSSSGKLNIAPRRKLEETRRVEKAPSVTISDAIATLKLDNPLSTQELTTIKNLERRGILKMKDHFTYECLSILKSRGFEEFIAFVNSVKPSPSAILESKIFDEARVDRKKEIFFFQQQEISITGIGVCSVCHSDKLNFSSKQTASADEETTIFYICNSCGHRWRGNVN